MVTLVLINPFGKNVAGPVTGIPSIIIYLLMGEFQAPLFINSSTNQWDFGTWMVQARRVAKMINMIRQTTMMNHTENDSKPKTHKSINHA